MRMRLRVRLVPNLLSASRLLLAPLCVWWMVEGRFGAALVVFVIAAVSDAVDGYIARRFHGETELGAYLDALADKLLMVGVYSALWWLGYLPLWLVGLVVARDVAIVIGAATLYWRAGAQRIAPSWVSKINTAAQGLLGALSLWHLDRGEGTSLAVYGLGFVVAATIAWSWAGYGLELHRRLGRRG